MLRRNVLYTSPSCHFLRKIDLLTHIGTRKMAKTQNIQNVETKCCSNTIKVRLYRFLGQLDHFPRIAYTFRQSFFFFFLPSQRIKCGFLAKNRPKIGEMFQNFGNR